MILSDLAVQVHTRFVTSPVLDRLRLDPARITKPVPSSVLEALAQKCPSFDIVKTKFEKYLAKEKDFFECLVNRELVFKEKIKLAHQIMLELQSAKREYLTEISRSTSFREYGQSLLKFSPLDEPIQIPDYKRRSFDPAKTKQEFHEYWNRYPNLRRVLIKLSVCKKLANDFPGLAEVKDEIQRRANLTRNFFNKPLKELSEFLSHEYPCFNSASLQKPFQVAAEILGLKSDEIERFAKEHMLQKYAYLFQCPKGIVDYILTNYPLDDYNSYLEVEGLEHDLQPAYELGGIRTSLRYEDWFGLAMDNEFHGGHGSRNFSIEASLRNIQDLASESVELGQAKFSNHPYGLGSWSEFRAAVALTRYKEAQDYDPDIKNTAKYKLMDFIPSKTGDDFDRNKIDFWLKLLDKQDQQTIKYAPLQVKFRAKALRDFQRKYGFDGISIEAKSLCDLQKDIEQILISPKKIISSNSFRLFNRVQNLPPSLIQEQWLKQMGQNWV